MKKKIFKYLNIEISRAEGSAGFALLFSVILSSILLAISIGVANIALKQVNFSTSAKDTNDAFFAADTGIECALRHDRSDATENAFVGTASMNCAGSAITLSGASPSWSFVVYGLGSSGQSFVTVSVVKNLGAGTTTIVSKGYNIGNASCNSSNANRVEREIQTTY